MRHSVFFPPFSHFFFFSSKIGQEKELAACGAKQQQQQQLRELFLNSTLAARQNVSRHHQPEVCLFNDTPPAPVALQAAETIRSFLLFIIRDGSNQAV